jgi:crotonobetainyl-CoA:carnitine CoA-transferase CaiB-like acyl-CoA transferase
MKRVLSSGFRLPPGMSSLATQQARNNVNFWTPNMTETDVQTKSSAKPALAGVRVLELGTFISAPFAATLLGDFGADVLKIELPGDGDPMRTLGAYPTDGESSYWWAQIARNKRSLALDVRTPEGREIFGRLVSTSDILIENFRPGTLERWGMTPDWFAERKPDLIMVRISGYGQDGPWRDVPGFDRNAQAFSGLVYVTGDPETQPQQAGLPVCDYTSGLWAAFGAVVAILGKLRHKDTGGNLVDLALYESMLPFLKDIPMTYAHEGKVTERTGNTPDYVAPGGSYKTGDGEWIFISGTGDRVFARLMTAIARPEMIEMLEFKENKARVANRHLIDEVINAWLQVRSTKEVLEQFFSADVPAVKINSIADFVGHPQVIARENFVDFPDGDRGEIRLTAPVPRLYRGGASIRWVGQHIGEANGEILGKELGISDEELADLKIRGVVG